jgi:hypothetical protein
MHPITSSTVIGIGLCKILGLPPSYAPALSLIIDTKDTSRVNRVLSDLRMDSDTVTIQERRRGMPGVPVSVADMNMLELKPFRVYRVGEVVAYSESSAADDDGKIAKESLCYAKILSVQEGDSGLKKISLRTGSGVVQVLPTEIHSFKSARDPSIGAGRTSSSPNAIKAPVKSTGAGASILSFTRLKDKNTVPDSSATTAPSADMSLPMSVSSSVISHDEIISALHGLLQRAGMPLSMDTKVYI